MKLNLACGMMKRDGFINIDKNKDCNPDRVRDITRGLPYADDSVDEIVCEHFIEHLSGENFIFFFNECWRVLKENCLLRIKAPYFQGKWAFIDPTHCRLITEWSFDFFINEDYNSVSAGVTGWYEPVGLKIVEGELSVELRKTRKNREEGMTFEKNNAGVK